MFGIFKASEEQKRQAAQLADLEKRFDKIQAALDQLAERLENLDPAYQRALQLKTTQEVSFMMDRFEELSTKILNRESASKRWTAKKEEQQAQLEFLNQFAQAAQAQAAQAPGSAPIQPRTNGVR